LKWFKNDFMRWTSTDPVCERCIAVDEVNSTTVVLATTMTAVVVVLVGQQ
jgi:hypothetical protein